MKTLKRAVRLSGAVLVLLTGALPVACAADSFTIPAGTTLRVELTTTLSSKTNSTGDLFTGKVTEPIFQGGEETVPERSIVQGHITMERPPGRVKGKAEMRLVVDTIEVPDGRRYSLAAALHDAQVPEGEKVKGEEGTVEGPAKDTKGGAVQTGIGAGVGAGIGAIAAGGTGALYGAGIGAAVAIVHALAKHHGDVVLPQGTEMTFVIPRTVTATRTTAPGAMVVPNVH